MSKSVNYTNLCTGSQEAYLRHILSVLPEWLSHRVDELLSWNIVPTNK